MYQQHSVKRPPPRAVLSPNPEKEEAAPDPGSLSPYHSMDNLTGFEEDAAANVSNLRDKTLAVRLTAATKLGKYYSRMALTESILEATNDIHAYFCDAAVNGKTDEEAMTAIRLGAVAMVSIPDVEPRLVSDWINALFDCITNKAEGICAAAIRAATLSHIIDPRHSVGDKERTVPDFMSELMAKLEADVEFHDSAVLAAVIESNALLCEPEDRAAVVDYASLLMTEDDAETAVGAVFAAGILAARFGKDVHFDVDEISALTHKKFDRQSKRELSVAVRNTLANIDGAEETLPTEKLLLRGKLTAVEVVGLHQMALLDMVRDTCGEGLTTQLVNNEAVRELFAVDDDLRQTASKLQTREERLEAINRQKDTQLERGKDRDMKNQSREPEN